MQYVDLTIRQPDWMLHPMQRFAREEDVVRYEELQGWNTGMAGSDVEYELFYVVADRTAYERKLRTVDSVRWYDLTPVDEASFYLYVAQETRPEDERWRSVFADLNLVVVPPIAYDEAGDFSMTVVGRDDDLQSLVTGLSDRVDVTVDALGEYDRRHAPIVDGVTDRQHEALRVAVELGLYDVPRTATLEEVAGELGVARSTASILLRDAESHVIPRLVDRHGRSTDEGDGPAGGS